MEYAQIDFLDITENEEYTKLINKVINKCFGIENINNSKIQVSVILTTPKNIKDINKEYRKIDSATDVLSFPMFEKEEIKQVVKNINYTILGDIIVNIDQVKLQAEEYEHSFERELAYMIVHGFYHLLGYDHMNEEDKKIMRQKEENVLNDLKINRE